MRFGGSPMTLCRTKSVRMQGRCRRAANVAQQLGRTIGVWPISNEKRMMAHAAYTWPSDSNYWPVYGALSDTTLPQRRPPYVGIPFNQAKAEGRTRIGFRRQMVADGGRWWDFAQIPPAERLRAGAALPVLSSSASAGRTGGLGAHRGQGAALGDPGTARLPTPEPPPVRRTRPETVPKPSGKCKNHTENRHKSR
jgi:hypothetical protein